MRYLKKGIFSLLINPVFIIGYIWGIYLIYGIMRFGRSGVTKYEIIGCFLLNIGCIAWAVKNAVNFYKNDDGIEEQDEGIIKIIWKYCMIILLIGVTSFFGYKVYNLIGNKNSKIYTLIDEVKNSTKIRYSHNNLFADGIEEGIFSDIRKEIDLPKELYVINRVNIIYNYDGTITSFNTSCYGKDNEGKIQGYSIEYCKDNSEYIKVHKFEVENLELDENKAMKPLIDTLKVIPFEDIDKDFNSEKYEICYYGKRSWGMNSEFMEFIDHKGMMRYTDYPTKPLVGYTVSVYIPGEEDGPLKVRFNLVDNLDNIYQYSDDNVGDPSGNNNDEATNKLVSFVSDKVGFKIDVVGAAMGSRWYSLSNTVNAGDDWKVVNGDVGGESGEAIGIKFIDEKIGFIAISSKTGMNSILYRTEDGGSTFTKCEFKFDYPLVPTSNGDILSVQVEQGVDGGNSVAIYESKDKGRTWVLTSENQ